MFDERVTRDAAMHFREHVCSQHLRHIAWLASDSCLIHFYTVTGKKRVETFGIFARLNTK